MNNTASPLRPEHGGPSVPYRADVDGLRALAIVPVVLFHAFPRGMPGGFIGVDVFFVISGYLITSLLWRELRETGRLSFIDFYARRINRIFPALAIALLLCAALGHLALFPEELGQVGKHVAGGAAFVTNFLLWGEAGYFDEPAESKPLLHLWSLGIEEQFYLVWPAFLLLAWKRNASPQRLIALAAFASFAANVIWIRLDPAASFYLPFTRLWELFAGAFLACRASDASTLRHGHVMSFAGAALLLASVFSVPAGPRFPGWWALMPVCGACLLIAAGPMAHVNRRLLSLRPLVWLGLISYPLYLYHWPLLSFLRIAESSTPPAGYRVLAIAISLALAAATYMWVERPVRRRANRRRSAALLAIAMAAIGAWGLSLYLANA